MNLINASTTRMEEVEIFGICLLPESGTGHDPLYR